MSYSKEVNRYVFPLVATNLVQVLIGQISLHFAVDNSNAALSGISVIQNFLFAFGGILGAFSLSFNIRGAKAFYNKEYQRFKNLLKSSLLIDIGIGLSFILFCLGLSRPFLKVFYGFDGQLLELSTTYFKIMSPYILLTLLIFLFSNLLKIEKKTKPIFWIGTLSSVLDVLLNYYLVPLLGIRGAAISSILSLLVIVLGYFIFVKSLVFQALQEASTSKLELIRFGIPLSIQEILESVLFIMAFDAFMGRQGLRILSIYAVVSQLFAIVRTPAFMYAGSIAIFLPEARKKEDEKALIATIFRNSYAVIFIFACLVTIFSNPFAHFLSDEVIDNVLPFTLYTVVVMGATPLYESSKMLLQSNDDEQWVLKITSIVNILSILILLVLQLMGKQTYQSLYGIYGLSLIVLSILFIKRNSEKRVSSRKMTM
ncbi:MATE family efflux transporter [Streptococcus mutans]|uniref:tryglysin-associated MATE efflux transporter WgkD n=1 Tax=Streptococcus mutans TaxID=1309 RepID=UPI0002B4F26A|nr:MATE family efflux transporter [Streptococcus mutans]EMC41853.1 hypothetical protein SMU98_09093 [Streptococcus mutans SM1]MCB5031521.1 polysaccharide biosynthesis C-terminal domain-containing protein [Streptococcus mutans]